MKAAWEWVKAHWKWLLFPFVAVATVIGWLLLRQAPQKPDVTSGTTDEAANKLAADLAKAEAEKLEAIKLLEEKHSEKLSVMTDEQRTEFDKVKDKPVEEIASWIDNL